MLHSTVFVLILTGIMAAAVFRVISPGYRAAFLCIISVAIYGLWAGLTAVIVLLAELTVGAVTIAAISKGRHPKICLSIGIISVTACLAFFKYKDIISFADTGAKSGIAMILMPLGISYYTFKIISAMADATSHSVALSDYFVYVTYFPQLICGPISRLDELKDYREAHPATEDIREGAYLILKGLFYKLVIADRLTVYTDSVFGSFMSHEYMALWMAAFLFSIELYCDFAGYSYIVIGLSRLFGFHIAENFNLPYFSRSIKEFWKRWHISLSSWLKDYIYIPLGGSKKGKIRKIINVLLVFAISGLWHGNTISYLLWGLWHGLWNILSPKSLWRGAKGVFGTIGTFIIVMFGWITFKIESLDMLLSYFRAMFGMRIPTMEIITDAIMPFSGDYSCVSKMLTAGLFIMILAILEYREYREKKQNRTLRVCIYFASVILFGIMGTNGFIYANY